MPKTSCEKSVCTLPCAGSVRCRVSFEPAAVTICCSLVPENCPRMACVMAVGGWMVSEYMNMDEVVAMVLDGPRSARFHRLRQPVEAIAVAVAELQPVV